MRPRHLLNWRTFGFAGLFLLCASLVMPMGTGYAQATAPAAQSSWKLLTKLVPKGFNGTQQNYLGMGMAAAKDILVVGAPFNNNYLGAVEVFTYNEAKKAWSQQAELKDSAAKQYDQFGRSVAVSDDGKLILVGSPYKNQSGGGITAFVLNGSKWTQAPAIAPPTDNQPGDFFGWQIVFLPPGTGAGPATPGSAPSAKMSDAVPASAQALNSYGFVNDPGASTGQVFLWVLTSPASTTPVRVDPPPPVGGGTGNKVRIGPGGLLIETAPGNRKSPPTFLAGILVVPAFVSQAGNLLRPQTSFSTATVQADFFQLAQVQGVNVPTPLTDPINGLGAVNLSAPQSDTDQSNLMADHPGAQANSTAAGLVVSLEGTVYLLSYANHALTLLDTKASPAGETYFGSALASCGSTVAVYGNDPKTPTNSAVHFYTVGADNKLQDAGSVAGDGVTELLTQDPEVSTAMTFSPDCNTVFVAASDLKTKTDEVDVIARSQAK